jgi:hypothetical protein
MSDEIARGGDGRTAAALRVARGARPSDDVAAQALISGQSWRDYCAALQTAGEHLLAANLDASPETHAAGVEYLLGLVRAGLGQALELADPAAPRFFRNPDSTSRWGAENADNQYLWTRIDPAHRYWIRGERGTSFDFLIEVKEGYMQLGYERNFATLRSEDVQLAEDGTFEIVLAADEQPGNWLPLDPDARYVAIRQFFCDWSNEVPARFAIERTDADAGQSAAPPTPADMGSRLQDAAEWTLETARFFSTWTDELRSAWRSDTFPPAHKYAGGADDIYYGNAYYKLGQDEALVIETALPRARYWQFQLCDLWFRSAPWADRQTSINQHQAVIDADDRFRCVVAPRDPGVPNWLDTAGEREGLVQYRWIWSETNPQPTAKLVPLASVRAALPSDTPVVTESERRAHCAERRRHRALREPES